MELRCDWCQKSVNNEISVTVLRSENEELHFKFCDVEHFLKYVTIIGNPPEGKEYLKEANFIINIESSYKPLERMASYISREAYPLFN